MKTSKLKRIIQKALLKEQRAEIMSKANKEKAIKLLDSTTYSSLLSTYIVAYYKDEKKFKDNGCPDPSEASKNIDEQIKTDRPDRPNEPGMSKHPLFWIAVGACVLIFGPDGDDDEDDDEIDGDSSPYPEAKKLKGKVLKESLRKRFKKLANITENKSLLTEVEICSQVSTAATCPCGDGDGGYGTGCGCDTCTGMITTINYCNGGSAVVHQCACCGTPHTETDSSLTDKIPGFKTPPPFNPNDNDKPMGSKVPPRSRTIM